MRSCPPGTAVVKSSPARLYSVQLVIDGIVLEAIGLLCSLSLACSFIGQASLCFALRDCPWLLRSKTFGSMRGGTSYMVTKLELGSCVGQFHSRQAA